MTVFIRLLELPVDLKRDALRDAVIAMNAGTCGANVFMAATEQFGDIPNSPFAYWLSNGVREVFGRLAPFESPKRTARQGLSTSDDFRFVRVWWEVPEPSVVAEMRRWFSFAKGGARSAYYGAMPATVNWASDGNEMKAWTELSSSAIRNTDWYFRAGLTWPLRGVLFSAQAVPEESIFSVAGKMAFAPKETLTAFLALFNSRLFDYLIGVSAGKVGGVQYEVGLISRLPVPDLGATECAQLTRRARIAWSLKRSLDATNEATHAFLLPTGLCEQITKAKRADVERELAELQSQIDDLAFGLYGISTEDRVAIRAPIRASAFASDDVEAEAPDDADEDDDRTAVSGGSEALGSWLVGVAFGRFDPRLATGERAIPPEPEPFDPLPVRSPGMYPEGEELADRPDILVDDEGHADDLAARTIAVAERVEVDEPENLRAWLAKEFFPLHIKMYSKSRRKAPIYWQLATPSASYSVWLYIHAFSKDTLFRVQNDYVAPKLAHEERRLESLTSELRGGATAAQRKTLAAQEAVVDELRAFLDEVKRVAPLWKPNLDDGVIINFAPLWRLVPQNRSWQKELKSTWDALCDGNYDWAHLAMHLWPERVVPKCAKDRSLAIAHGLEDVFWVEGTDGKWTAHKTPTRSVDELVREQTSPAVNSALKSLLEAPAAAGKSGRRRGGVRDKVALPEDLV
ncbi:MAG: type II restriction endonuclease subunit M [Planctomycetes bacterium]|nr:type II restriction endonuclease subunit M [Planctomycetota bacterium]